jgi:hypothetical protein
MARAKAQGKHVGRRRLPAQKETAIRRDLLAGRSLRSTIKALGVGFKTVRRIKAGPGEFTPHCYHLRLPGPQLSFWPRTSLSCAVHCISALFEAARA